jgi:mono/diheme cytochrome c family protein
MMRIVASGLVAISLAAAIASCRNEPNAARLMSGGQAYLAECAICHGTSGRGNGPLSPSIVGAHMTPPAVLDSARVASLGRNGLRRAMESGAHQRPGSSMPLWGPFLGPKWLGRIADWVRVMPSQSSREREEVARYLGAPGDGSGRSTYVLYCSGCHGPQGGGDGFFSANIAARMNPPTLRGEALAAMDPAKLMEMVAMGGAHAPDAATMPGWLHAIPEEDREALVTYLKTLPGTRE